MIKSVDNEVFSTKRKEFRIRLRENSFCRQHLLLAETELEESNELTAIDQEKTLIELKK